LNCGLKALKLFEDKTKTEAYSVLNFSVSVE